MGYRMGARESRCSRWMSSSDMSNGSVRGISMNDEASISVIIRRGLPWDETEHDPIG